MSGPNLQAVASSIAALETAITTLGTIEGASTLDLAPSVLAAQTAAAAIDTAIAANDALIDTSGVFGIATGVFAPALLTQLLSQQATMQAELALMIQKGAVGRILVNLGIATT